MWICWINQMLWFGLTIFPNLVLIQKIMVIWNHNWMITTIDQKLTWRRRFHNNYSPQWAAPDLHHFLPLRLSRLCLIRYCCVDKGYFSSIYCETAVVSLSTWIRSCWWWWNTTGNFLSPMENRIQIVYIYYLWLNMFLNIYLVHAEYFYS